MHTCRRLFPLAVLAVAVAACGGAAKHFQGSTSTTWSSSTPTPTTGGENAAKTVLVRMAAALSRVHSFRIWGYAKGLDGSTSSLHGVFELPGRLRLQVARGEERSELVMVGQYVYVMANRAYWLDHAPQVAATLSGRWVRLSRSFPGMSTWYALTQPRSLAHCVGQSHIGKIALAGMASVNGRQAAVIVSRGGLPGSVPGRFYVARSGPPLPLRSVQTGRPQPGGAPDPVCGETAATYASRATIVASEENFGAYNKPVTIAAPKHAITPPGTSPQKPVL